MARRKGTGSRDFKPRVYISGMQFRYDWEEHQVIDFITHYAHMRQEEYTDLEIISNLADCFGRNPVEVSILIMDLGERGYISAEGIGTNPRPFRIADCDEDEIIRRK